MTVNCCIGLISDEINILIYITQENSKTLYKQKLSSKSGFIICYIAKEQQYSKGCSATSMNSANERLQQAYYLSWIIFKHILDFFRDS